MANNPEREQSDDIGKNIPDRERTMTPTPEQIEAAAKTIYDADGDSCLWCNLPKVTIQTYMEIAKAALTAAAGVGEPIAPTPEQIHKAIVDFWKDHNATIERCAQVARRYATNIGEMAETIAVEIEALKDKPQGS